MNINYVQRAFDSIYLAGDLGDIYFQELLGWISFDMDEEDESKDWLGKTEKQRTEDVLQLIEYLVEIKKDFRIFHNVRLKDGSFEWQNKIFNEFNMLIKNISLTVGISDFDSTVSLALAKCVIGKSAPLLSEIPNNIVALFQPV